METLTNEQIDFLDKQCLGKWENSEKGIIVDGNIWICNLKIEKLPVRFYKVDGYFDCSYNYLTSLEGCPEYVEGSFNCSYNKLTSLEGCPEYVEGYFDCANNNLISLEGIGEVKVRIFCEGNKINYKKEKELRPEIIKKIKMTTLEKMFVYY